jgi:hypothetical protein
MTNELTIAEAAAEIVKLAGLNMPIMISSAPGIGKTSIVRQVAAEMGLPYFERRLAEMEGVDLRGGAYMDEKTEMLRWFRNAEWPTEKCVICFDEFNLAAEDTLSVALKLIRELQIGDFKLHPETIIVATANRMKDGAFVRQLSSAVRESFIQLEVRADAAQWLDWYGDQDDKNETVEKFIRANRELLHQFDGRVKTNQPSPRNWHKLGRVLTATKHAGIIAGIVGEDAANSFIAFLDTQVEMPTVLEVIGGYAEIPTAAVSVPVFFDSVAEFIIDDCGNSDKHREQAATILAGAPVNLMVKGIATILKNPNGRATVRGFDCLMDCMIDHADLIKQAAS